MGRALKLLGGTAAGELVVRGFAELLGLGASEAVPAAAVLAARAAPGLPLLGWALGWLLLGMVVFQTLSLLIPVEGADWAASYRGRFAVAGAVVVVAVAVETLLMTDLRGLSTPFRVGEPLLWVPVVVAVGSYAVATSGSEPLETEFVYDLDAAGGTMDGGAVTFGRYLLFVLVLGLLLAEVSLLFPVPELVVLGSGGIGAFGADLSFGRRLNLPGGRDVAERLARGAAVIWTGVEHLAFLTYALMMLLFAFIAVGGTFLRVDVVAVGGDDPAVALLFLVAMLTILLTVVLTVDRYLERLYYRATDNPGRRNDVLRMPGLLVPAGVLTIAIETAGPGVPVNYFLTPTQAGPLEINTLGTLEPTTATWVLAAVGLGLSVAVLLDDGQLPRLPGPDAVTMPLSGVAFMALLYYGGYPDAPFTAPVESAILLAFSTVVFGGYPTAYRVLLGGEHRPTWERVFVGFGISFLGLFFMGLLFSGLGATASASAITGPIGGAFAAVFLLLLFVCGTYLAVLPFTMPRKAAYAIALLAGLGYLVGAG